MMMLIIHILIINDCTTTKNNAGDKTHNGHYNSNSNNNNTYIYIYSYGANVQEHMSDKPGDVHQPTRV